MLWNSSEMSSWLIEPILELFKELKKILDAAAAAARYFFAYPRKKVACERKHNQTRWQESGLQKENFDKILGDPSSCIWIEKVWKAKTPK